MQLYKGYPVPSDRMGLLWALSTVKDLYIVEFGPEGTTRSLLESLKYFGTEVNAKIFTTMMDEETVILGETDKLRKGLIEIDEKYAPELIIVMGSSVASVIGLDIEGLCHAYQRQIKAKLLPIEAGGLKGDWTGGYAAAMNLLAEMAVGGPREKGVFQLLGCFAGTDNAKTEAKEVKTLLKKAFHHDATRVFSLQASLDDCRNMGNAALNLILRREALPAAELLQERFGTPYIYGHPQDPEETRHWLQQIEAITGFSLDETALFE